MADYVEFSGALFSAIIKERLELVGENHFKDGNIRLNHREEIEEFWDNTYQGN